MADLQLLQRIVICEVHIESRVIRSQRKKNLTMFCVWGNDSVGKMFTAEGRISEFKSQNLLKVEHSSIHL